MATKKNYKRHLKSLHDSIGKENVFQDCKLVMHTGLFGAIHMQFSFDR